MPVSQNGLAKSQLYRFLEARAVEDEGVEFSILAARIDIRREVTQKLVVYEPAR